MIAARRRLLCGLLFQLIGLAHAHEHPPDSRMSALESGFELIDRVAPRAAGRQFQGHSHEDELRAYVHRQHFVHSRDPVHLGRDAMDIVDDFTVGLSPINNPLVSYASHTAEALKTQAMRIEATAS